MKRIIITFIWLVGICQLVFAGRNVSPDIGLPGATFTFTVRYWHSNNIFPKENYPLLYLYRYDKSVGTYTLVNTYSLEYVGKNEPKDTATYMLVLRLDVQGSYSHRFEAYDKNNLKATGPATEMMVGPIVIAPSPISEPQIILPIVTKLYNPYPNPIIYGGGSSLILPFDLATKQRVRMNIYNIVGQLVRTIDLGELPPGKYRDLLKWNLSNNQGERVTTGIYFITFEAGEYRTTQRIAIIK